MFFKWLHRFQKIDPRKTARCINTLFRVSLRMEKEVQHIQRRRVCARWMEVLIGRYRHWSAVSARSRQGTFVWHSLSYCFCEGFPQIKNDWILSATSVRLIEIVSRGGFETNYCSKYYILRGRGSELTSTASTGLIRGRRPSEDGEMYQQNELTQNTCGVGWVLSWAGVRDKALTNKLMLFCCSYYYNVTVMATFGW